MITLDGSSGEGGGQILRTALALSAFRRLPFRISNIRANRPNPGLKPQHLIGITALAKLCNAKFEGAVKGSQKVAFYPDEYQPQTLSIDIGTAGSCTLLLQSLLLPALVADGKSRFRIRGGTDVPFSPQIDYFSNVLVPQLKRFAEIDVNLERRGYYPAGGGRLDIQIKPFISGFTERKEPRQHCNPYKLSKKKELMQITGVSHASADLDGVADRCADAAKRSLASLRCPITIRREYVKSFSKGAGITLWAKFGSGETDDVNPVILGADELGQKGKRAEEVGADCAIKLLTQVSTDAAVDVHLADQLIPFMALCGGTLTAPQITGHLKSNISVVESFLKVKYLIENRTITLES